MLDWPENICVYPIIYRYCDSRDFLNYIDFSLLTVYQYKIYHVAFGFPPTIKKIKRKPQNVWMIKASSLNPQMQYVVIHSSRTLRSCDFFFNGKVLGMSGFSWYLKKKRPDMNTINIVILYTSLKFLTTIRSSSSVKSLYCTHCHNYNRPILHNYTVSCCWCCCLKPPPSLTWGLEGMDGTCESKREPV